LAAVLVAVAIGVGLGALGTALVTPGRSLAVPTAIVAVIGGSILLASWVVASFRAGRQAVWTFAVGVAAMTALACVWTFEFALPAAIEWSDATAQAEQSLSLAQHSPQNVFGTVPSHPCVTHTSGSIGPLDAPYKACTIWTPIGHLVEYNAIGTGAQGGLVYTDRPSASFEDECARHLVGRWWMFAPAKSNDSPGSCYIGYRFSGGG
jgi:hypothetical protein